MEAEYCHRVKRVRIQSLQEISHINDSYHTFYNFIRSGSIREKLTFKKNKHGVAPNVVQINIIEQTTQGTSASC